MRRKLFWLAHASSSVPSTVKCWSDNSCAVSRLDSAASKERGRDVAVEQRISILREGGRRPDRVVHDETDKPTKQDVVLQLLHQLRLSEDTTNCRASSPAIGIRLTYNVSSPDRQAHDTSNLRSRAPRTVAGRARRAAARLGSGGGRRRDRTVTDVASVSRTTGPGARELYLRVKAQSEAGVQQWGQVVFGYNAATERLEIPLIRVRKADGSVIDTPSTSIQDLSSPVERIAPVYTDFRQKHVTVQSLRPGDTLEVRAVTTIHTALAPGQFWSEYSFEETAIVLDEQLDIDVPAARRVTLKLRPGFDPAVKEADGRRTYHWARSHAVRKERPDEAGKKEPADLTTVRSRSPIRLTTFADWKEVGGWFAGLERAARKVTPEIQEKARTLTAGRTTDVEKLEALYDFVSKNFRYVSLSLGAGRYQPRAAADVLRDAYGDCKDKHTLLATLIDAAGLQASAVLINSRVKIDPDFPSPSQFDHVITRARAEGQDVWLDSTPEVAPFRLLSYGLRKKQALVTQAALASRLEETPADPPMASFAGDGGRGHARRGRNAEGRRLVRLRGDAELARARCSAPRRMPGGRTLVEAMAKDGGLDGPVYGVRVSDPQATKEQFTIAFHVEAPGFRDLAGRKSDLVLPMSGDYGRRACRSPARFSGRARRTRLYSFTLRVPALAKLRAPVPVNVTRDYGDTATTYDGVAGRADRAAGPDHKQRELPQERRSDYPGLHPRALARTPSSTVDRRHRIAAAPLSPDAKAQQLNRSGYDALEAGDYAEAVTLLRRALELDPKASGARVNLARAHLSLRQPAEALEVLQKQIEANPYDEYAYFYMARAYVAQQQVRGSGSRADQRARDQSARQVRSRRARRAVHGAAAGRESGAGLRESGRGESRSGRDARPAGQGVSQPAAEPRGGGRVRSRGRACRRRRRLERRGLPAVARRRRPRARAAVRGVGDLVGRRGLAQSRRRARGRAGARHRRLARGLLGHARLGLLRQRGSRQGRDLRRQGVGDQPARGSRRSPRTDLTSGSAAKRRRSAPTPRRCRPTTRPGRSANTWHGWRAAPERSTRSSRTHRADLAKARTIAWRGKVRPARKPTS